MYLPLIYAKRDAEICIRIDDDSYFGENKQVYCELQVGPLDENGKLRFGQKRGTVLHAQSSAKLRDLDFSLPKEMKPWSSWRVQLKVWTCTCLPFGFTRHHGSFIGKTAPLAIPFRTQTSSLWLDQRRGGTETSFSVTWSAQRRYCEANCMLTATKLLSRDIVAASLAWDDELMAGYFRLISDGWDGCEQKCLELILHAYKPTSILYEAVRRKKSEATKLLVQLGAPLHQLHVEEYKSPYTLALDLDYVDVLLDGAHDAVASYTFKQLLLSNYWDVILYRLRRTESPDAWVSRAAVDFAWSKRWPKVALEVVNGAVDGAFADPKGLSEMLGEAEWREVGNALLKKCTMDADILRSVFGSSSEETQDIILDGLRKRQTLPKVLLFQRCTECLICFEPTYASIPSYFTNMEGVRTCVHYLCHACALMVASNGECPICRVPIWRVVPVPSIKEPQAWFKNVDAMNNGHLTKLEVLAALEACLPLDKQKLAEAMNELWESWAGEDDVINIDDFYKPDGLFQFVLLHEDQMMRDLELGCFGEDCVLPAISSPAKWFDFWSDGVHLNEFDMLRGLLKTLKISSIEREKMYEIRDRLHEALEDFSRESEEVGTGEEIRIDKEEFIKPGGIGELLMATFFPTEQPILSRDISTRGNAEQPALPREISRPQAIPVASEGVWEIHEGSWVPVSDFLQTLLDASLHRGSSSVQFHIDGCDYEVTFAETAMGAIEGTQTNLSTSAVLQLRRQMN